MYSLYINCIYVDTLTVYIQYAMLANLDSNFSSPDFQVSGKGNLLSRGRKSLRRESILILRVFLFFLPLYASKVSSSTSSLAASFSHRSGRTLPHPPSLPSLSSLYYCKKIPHTRLSTATTPSRKLKRTRTDSVQRPAVWI